MHKMYSELEQTILSKIRPFEPTEQRKEIVLPLLRYVQEKIRLQQPILLNFICTHNSRRSHLAQIWAQTAAYYFNLTNVYCYSGGTEVTSLFPAIVSVLSQQGFQIQQLAVNEQPFYAIKFADNQMPILGFSKLYNNCFNPSSDFAAVLTCSQADVGCPYIAGAAQRISISFNDPKVSDGTPEQDFVYSERSLAIAREMFYVFAQINRNEA